jgi:hypothetical protein
LVSHLRARRACQPMPPLILLLKDEPAIADTLLHALQEEGF